MKRQAGTTGEHKANCNRKTTSQKGGIENTHFASTKKPSDKNIFKRKGENTRKTPSQKATKKETRPTDSTKPHYSPPGGKKATAIGGEKEKPARTEKKIRRVPLTLQGKDNLSLHYKQAVEVGGDRTTRPRM